jgi:hypothetical protein
MPIAFFHGYFDPGLTECLKFSKSSQDTKKSSQFCFPKWIYSVSTSIIASIIENMEGMAAQVFCAGTITIKVQQIALKHSRALARAIHLLQLSLEIAGVFLNTPDMDGFVGRKYICELQFEAINCSPYKSKSKR